MQVKHELKLVETVEVSQAYKEPTMPTLVASLLDRLLNSMRASSYISNVDRITKPPESNTPFTRIRGQIQGFNSSD